MGLLGIPQAFVTLLSELMFPFFIGLAALYVLGLFIWFVFKEWRPK